MNEVINENVTQKRTELLTVAIKKPDLTCRGEWSFKFIEGYVFSARVLDQEFAETIVNGERSIKHGDKLKVKLEMTQTYSKYKVRMKYKVLDVLEYIIDDPDTDNVDGDL